MSSWPWLAGDREGVPAAVDQGADALNPHPGTSRAQRSAGRRPRAWGLQHKYRETLLVFPRQGQTCHTYCGYCFRWAQFVGPAATSAGVPGPETMTSYLDRHPEVTDVLLTGGDPLVMRTELLRRYLEPLLAPAASTSPPSGSAPRPSRLAVPAAGRTEADGLLRCSSGCRRRQARRDDDARLARPRSCDRPARAALSRLASTGAVLRAQAPVVRTSTTPAGVGRHVAGRGPQGVAPYYMFVERDTGARRYFGLPLAARWTSTAVPAPGVGSGAHRAGPVMSATPGKVAVDGEVDLGRGAAFSPRMLEARDPVVGSVLRRP